MSTPFVGEIRLFGFSRIPDGWFACDGSLQPISQYDVLFALIGTTYGGDGQSTFGVPDLRGQVPIHQGTGNGLTTRVLGQNGGNESVTLLTNNLPAHTHAYSTTTATAGASAPSSNALLGALSTDKMYATDLTGATAFALASSAVTISGNSIPHENTMPTLTASYCIAWTGIFPSQG